MEKTYFLPQPRFRTRYLHCQLSLSVCVLIVVHSEISSSVFRKYYLKSCNCHESSITEQHCAHVHTRTLNCRYHYWNVSILQQQHCAHLHTRSLNCRYQYRNVSILQQQHCAHLHTRSLNCRYQYRNVSILQQQQHCAHLHTRTLNCKYHYWNVSILQQQNKKHNGTERFQFIHISLPSGDQPPYQPSAVNTIMY